MKLGVEPKIVSVPEAAIVRVSAALTARPVLIGGVPSPEAKSVPPDVAGTDTVTHAGGDAVVVWDGVVGTRSVQAIQPTIVSEVAASTFQQSLWKTILVSIAGTPALGTNRHCH